MATLSGTVSSAGAGQGLLGERGHLVGLLGHHVDQDLVVDLEDQVRGEPPALRVRRPTG